MRPENGAAAYDKSDRGVVSSLDPSEADVCRRLAFAQSLSGSEFRSNVMKEALAMCSN